MRITVGFEIGTGAKVEIPLHHTIITGMTGSGKTTLIKRIIGQLDKVLVIDVKNDYVELTTVPPKVTADIPDALTLKDLLEVYGGISLRGEFPELIKVVNESTDLWDVLERIRRFLKLENIHPIRRDKLLVIGEILQKFLRDIRPLLTFVREKEYDVMRVDVSPLPLALQQYIVNEEIRALENGRVLVLDEAHRFVPEREASISKREVINLLREGRSRRNFVILSDQTITGISKEGLKQCWNWIMGKQIEVNEIKRVLMQTMHLKRANREIASLRVGEFIYFTPEDVIRFYSWPPYMSKEEAISRAIEMGNILDKKAVKKEFVNGRSDNELMELLKNLKNLIRDLKGIVGMLEKKSIMRRESEALDPKEIVLELVRKRPGISESFVRKYVAEIAGISELHVFKILRELIEKDMIKLKANGEDVVLLPSSTMDEFFFT